MIDFVNRTPTEPNKFNVTKLDGSTERVTIVRDDYPTNTGTFLNRKSFMAIQGFIGVDIDFLPNGNILETNTDGDTLLTEFLPDGNILATFTGVSGAVIHKKTIFLSNGNIREEVY